MREIKFRAWDKRKTLMVDSFHLELIDYDECCIGYWHEETGDVYQGFPHIELMQFTGLKDKNGKEIYEGDIVGYFKTSYSTIEWKGGGFIIKRIDDGEYETMQNRIAEIEVIGNAYQNPELLEGAEE